MMLAMTSIAVTASVCASTCEAALFVASFMSISPKTRARLVVARERANECVNFTRNTPSRVFA
jgi:hypothetical protein